MLKLQSIGAGGVRLFDVEVVLVVVAGVYDADAKRLGVSKYAVVDAVDVKVLHDGLVAPRSQDRVDPLQSLVELPHYEGLVDQGLPERVFPVGVVERRSHLEAF